VAQHFLAHEDSSQAPGRTLNGVKIDSGSGKKVNHAG
jgi:hypothetical protein